MTSLEIQRIGDHHHKATVSVIQSGDKNKIDLHLFCINYMVKAERDGREPVITWGAQQSVMHGWLTVNSKNEYEVRV